MKKIIENTNVILTLDCDLEVDATGIWLQFFNKPKTLYPTHHLYLYPFQGADTILRKLVEVHSQAL